MATLMKHTAVWAGAVGLPGYSSFYHHVSDPISDSAQEGSNSVRDFFSDLQGAIPGAVSVAVDPVYQLFDEVTGALVGEGSVAAPAATTQGTNADGYSAQVGVLVEWLTGAFIGGRRLRGRTYLVPLAGIFDTDGELTVGGKAIVDGALFNITASPQDFVVWHRPVNGAGGSSSSITSGVTRDHAAILRSRMR